MSIDEFDPIAGDRYVGHVGAWIFGRDAVTGDVWIQSPGIVMSSGPHTEVNAHLPEQHRTWPAGFTAPLKPSADVEPLLWDGDQG